MRYIRLAALSLLVLSSPHLRAEGPLIMVLPAGWQLEYKADKGIKMYAVTPPPKGSGVLMFSKWPAATDRDDIPGLVQQLAEGFLKAGKDLIASEKYELGAFGNAISGGNFAAFQIKGGDKMVQIMFAMGIEGETWNGQFTGTSEQWKQALELLRTLRQTKK